MNQERRLRQTEQAIREMEELEGGKDILLWSIAILAALILVVSAITIAFPDLVWNAGSVKLDGRLLAQIVFAFVSLIILFNLYALRQQYLLERSRQELFQQIARADTAEKISYTDPLTGLFNRRYMEHIMVTEVKRADRTGGELSLLIIDLDDFGEVNKTLGHLEGDRVLADVARLLTRIFRQSDTVIRFGGDEFVVIMPDTTEEQARASRERLVAQVVEWNASRPADAYQVSLSAGVSVYEQGGKVADLFENADRAMRMQKASREVAV